MLAAESEPRRTSPSITTETSLERALRRSDVVFSAIRVGGAEARARDERRALRAGVLGQETVGLAGITYGLRTLPVALRIAARVADLAPTAWFVNFTNPAGMITEALRPVLGNRVIGICDSPNGLITRVRALFGVSAAEVTADYIGINHCGWLRSMRIGDRDLLVELTSSDELLDSFEEGRLFGARILRALGCVPNEYVHFYYAAAELTGRLRDDRSRGEILAAEQRAFYDAARARPTDAAALWTAAHDRREASYLAESRPGDRERATADMVGGYQDVALNVVEALTTDRPATMIVNVPNATGGPDTRDPEPAIPGLPTDMVVETYCHVDGAGAVPVATAAPDLHQLGLVSSVRGAERAAIEAVRTGDRSLAYRALVTHPLGGSPAAAQAVLDGLLADEPDMARLLR